MIIPKNSSKNSLSFFQSRNTRWQFIKCFNSRICDTSPDGIKQTHSAICQLNTLSIILSIMGGSFIFPHQKFFLHVKLPCLIFYIFQKQFQLLVLCIICLNQMYKSLINCKTAENRNINSPVLIFIIEIKIITNSIYDKIDHLKIENKVIIQITTYVCDTLNIPPFSTVSIVQVLKRSSVHSHPTL